VGKSKAAVPVDGITRAILVLRGHRVLLDGDLAALYGVETKVLVQAVKRNAARFPSDFMFQLADVEWSAVRSQIVTLKPGRGRHRKYLPYAFTEQGVAMLSSVLRNPRAISVNIEIIEGSQACQGPTNAPLTSTTYPESVVSARPLLPQRMRRTQLFV
jgi:ORF6N domain